MKLLRALSFGLVLAVGPGVALAQSGSASPSPYAGFETREIKSLSETDIEELRSGGGWGLALPAELNGVPGPAHLLELRDQIPLSAEQVTAIEEIYETLLVEAAAAGERLIEAEAAIEDAFRTGGFDDATLRELIADAESARAELRYIHLSRHLSTPPLLSARQVARYNVLRGYGVDPCSNVPEGHNAAMWRRHNNCS
ncbi:hypothetical protein [Salinarimonas ramus]|nr:hypothetical protein [Salinarimonas ramus]